MHKDGSGECERSRISMPLIMYTACLNCIDNYDNTASF